MGDLGTISPYVALEGAGTLISILVSFSLSTPATSDFLTVASCFEREGPDLH